MFEVLVTEMKLRNDSHRSIEAYVYHNKKFIEFIKKKPQEVTNDDVRNYLIHLMQKNVKPRTTRLIISALKFYYSKILKRNLMKEVTRPKVPKTIVKILDQDDILKMINVTKNIKHKLLIELLYSSGVRISEALNVKKEDILLEKKFLIVRQGKGKKDRITLLSDKFLKDYVIYNTQVKTYLFESSYNAGKPISVRTAEMIIENSARLAGITKSVHPHMLRASFATHSLNNGVELYKISSLIGHTHIDTTRKAYICMNTRMYDGVKSPLDVAVN